MPYKLRYKKRKTLLYKTDVEYGDWCINHVENCAHGCNYPCYAMMMAKRFGRIKTYSDWLCPILVKNSLELLNKEIPKYKDKIEFVHLCFMTDPFMVGYAEIEDMTIAIIKKLNDHNIKATVLTKGVLPKKLVGREYYNTQNEYGITLVSLAESFRSLIEPNTAKYKDRINALEFLSKKGLKTWISMEPFPTPNIDKETDINKLLEEVSFVNKIVFGKLNYNVKSSKYKGSSEYYEDCADKVISFCEKHDIEYHIKFGTKQNNNQETAQIFKNNQLNQNLELNII